MSGLLTGSSAVNPLTETLRQVLDALLAHAALLDAAGRTLFVNRAWRAADEEPAPAVGVSYLDVCGPALAGRLRDVLEGRAEAVKHEYPCHTPTARRWFLAEVRRLEAAGGLFLVTLADVTARTIAQQEARQAREELLRWQGPVEELPALSVVPTAWADTYGRLLDQAVEQRLYKLDHGVTAALRRLADEIGAARAGPREVIRLHRAVVQRRLDSLNESRAGIYAEESRLKLLELMGDLVSFYRDHCGPRSPPEAPPD
jgi:hypothetical protein